MAYINGYDRIIRQAYYTHPREDALVMLKPLNTRLSDWVSQVFDVRSAEKNANNLSVFRR